MKSENYFIGNISSRSLANANGKIFTQFMNVDLKKESLSGKKALEESIRMEGYEVSARNLARNRPDLQQSMLQCSEFWIG